MDLESKTLQEGSNTHGGCLLSIHTYGECLDTAQEKERIEGRQGVTNGVDDERDLLEMRE